MKNEKRCYTVENAAKVTVDEKFLKSVSKTHYFVQV